MAMTVDDFMDGLVKAIINSGCCASSRFERAFSWYPSRIPREIQGALKEVRRTMEDFARGGR
jgi:hypothetical protein